MTVLFVDNIKDAFDITFRRLHKQCDREDRPITQRDLFQVEEMLDSILLRLRAEAKEEEE